MLTGGLAALGSALLFGIATVWQAQAARVLPGFDSGGLRAFVRSGLRSPLMLLVVFAYLCGFALHAVAIWMLPLYVAQAAIALSMPVTAALSSHRLHEPLGRAGVLGVLGVTGGLVLLGIGAGPAGEPVATTSYAVWLAAGLVVVLALGLLASRGRGPAAALGALAGCGYAGSALAVRGAEAFPAGPALVAALVVPGFGLVAFWLYSSAMARTRVASATAGVLGVETFLPAVIGVWFLGDGVRDGFAWAVLAGLVVTVLGAVALAGRAGVAQAS